jgi:hypothetical protein
MRLRHWPRSPHFVVAGIGELAALGLNLDQPGFHEQPSELLRELR